MTVFKVYKQGSFFYYQVNTKSINKALATLWRTFGDAIRYDVIINRKQ